MASPCLEQAPQIPASGFYGMQSAYHSGKRDMSPLNPGGQRPVNGSKSTASQRRSASPLPEETCQGGRNSASPLRPVADLHRGSLNLQEDPYMQGGGGFWGGSSTCQNLTGTATHRLAPSPPPPIAAGAAASWHTDAAQRVPDTEDSGWTWARAPGPDAPAPTLPVPHSHSYDLSSSFSRSPMHQHPVAGRNVSCTGDTGTPPPPCGPFLEDSYGRDQRLRDKDCSPADYRGPVDSSQQYWDQQYYSHGRKHGTMESPSGPSQCQLPRGNTWASNQAEGSNGDDAWLGVPHAPDCLSPRAPGVIVPERRAGKPRQPGSPRNAAGNESPAPRRHSASSLEPPRGHGDWAAAAADTEETEQLHLPQRSPRGPPQNQRPAPSWVQAVGPSGPHSKSAARAPPEQRPVLAPWSASACGAGGAPDSLTPRGMRQQSSFQDASAPQVRGAARRCDSFSHEQPWSLEGRGKLADSQVTAAFLQLPGCREPPVHPRGTPKRHSVPAQHRRVTSLGDAVGAHMGSPRSSSPGSTPGRAKSGAASGAGVHRRVSSLTSPGSSAPGSPVGSPRTGKQRTGVMGEAAAARLPRPLPPRIILPAASVQCDSDAEEGLDAAEEEWGSLGTRGRNLYALGTPGGECVHPRVSSDGCGSFNAGVPVLTGARSNAPGPGTPRGHPQGGSSKQHATSAPVLRDGEAIPAKTPPPQGAFAAPPLQVDFSVGPRPRVSPGTPRGPPQFAGCQVYTAAAAGLNGDQDRTPPRRRCAVSSSAGGVSGADQLRSPTSLAGGGGGAQWSGPDAANIDLQGLYSSVMEGFASPSRQQRQPRSSSSGSRTLTGSDFSASFMSSSSEDDPDLEGGDVIDAILVQDDDCDQGGSPQRQKTTKGKKTRAAGKGERKEEVSKRGVEEEVRSQEGKKACDEAGSAENSVGRDELAVKEKENQGNAKKGRRKGSEDCSGGGGDEGLPVLLRKSGTAKGAGRAPKRVSFSDTTDEIKEASLGKAMALSPGSAPVGPLKGCLKSTSGEKEKSVRVAKDDKAKGRRKGEESSGGSTGKLNTPNHLAKEGSEKTRTNEASPLKSGNGGKKKVSKKPHEEVASTPKKQNSSREEKTPKPSGPITVIGYFVK